MFRHFAAGRFQLRRRRSCDHLFAQGLASLLWKESIVNHMSEVSWELKTSLFRNRDYWQWVLGKAIAVSEARRKLTREEILWFQMFLGISVIICKLRSCFCVLTCGAKFASYLFCKIAKSQQRVKASVWPKARSCQPQQLGKDRIMHWVIDGGKSTPLQTVPIGAYSLRISQLRLNDCIDISKCYQSKENMKEISSIFSLICFNEKKV